MQFLPEVIFSEDEAIQYETKREQRKYLQLFFLHSLFAYHANAQKSPYLKIKKHHKIAEEIHR